MKVATSALIACVAGLLSLGMVVLYSSSTAEVGAGYLIKQLLWCVLGLVGASVVAGMDYRKFKKFTVPLLILSVVLLCLVFVPQIGIKVKGASRWIGYGGFRFQPSELAKIALILFIAHYGDRYSRQMSSFWRGLVVPGLVIACMLALIFPEPDRGCTILMAGVAAVMLLVAGARWRFILPPVIAGIVALGISFANDPMRLRRIMSWLDPEATREGTGWQAYQALIALGAGGWRGLGLGQGRQKLGFIPEHHTDFIFSTIGEELGLIATLGVVGAFFVFVICGMCIAARARDTFGFLLASGATIMVAFQALINMGVVTSLLPNKGMPLPFISYGGSNLLIMMLTVGILLSVARQAVEPASRKLNPFNDELPSPQLS